MNELLRIERLSKSFGRRAVLRGLDAVLEPGRVYGLLGRNGEGKTTLVRTILGVLPADSGAISYRGRPVALGSWRYKEKIGYVPEDPFFYGWMTVRGLLEFNRRFYPGGDPQRSAARLEEFGLDPGSRVRTLSRGQRLKLAFAAALAARPELLILDDPTSGLDVPTRRDFLRDIVRELADGGATVLFATHLVHELERIVDHLLILDGGRLVLDEPHEKVKELARRAVLRFDNDPPALPDLGSVIGERRNGRDVELVLYPWSEDAGAALRALGPARLEIERLDLEDIFTSFVDRPKKAGEGADHV